MPTNSSPSRHGTPSQPHTPAWSNSFQTVEIHTANTDTNSTLQPPSPSIHPSCFPPVSETQNRESNQLPQDAWPISKPLQLGQHEPYHLPPFPGRPSNLKARRHRHLQLLLPHLKRLERRIFAPFQANLRSIHLPDYKTHTKEESRRKKGKKAMQKRQYRNEDKTRRYNVGMLTARNTPSASPASKMARRRRQRRPPTRSSVPGSVSWPAARRR